MVQNDFNYLGFVSTFINLCSVFCERIVHTLGAIFIVPFFILKLSKKRGVLWH